MVKRIIKKFVPKNYSVKQARLNSVSDEGQYSASIKKVINLLRYTRENNVSYSGYGFDTGYHTLRIGEHTFNGQRNPRLRFKDLPFSLRGLTVLDVGCNQGGMLHEFSDEICQGIGIDYDYKMINIANKISAYNKTNNLNFYVFDLEKENLDYLQDFLPENKVDVALVLSICMWVKNWKEVILKVKTLSNKMIFESNGKKIVQEEQIGFLNSIYEKVELINEKSDDDATQKCRKLLVCS